MSSLAGEGGREGGKREREGKGEGQERKGVCVDL